MRERQHYNVGDTVRICREGYGEPTFQFGVVEKIEDRDVSYHGSAEIVYNYHVRVGDSINICNYMNDYTGNRFWKSYICPVPTRKDVSDKTNREIAELKEKIRKMECEIQKKKDFLSDVCSGKIGLDTIKLY